MEGGIEKNEIIFSTRLITMGWQPSYFEVVFVNIVGVVLIVATFCGGKNKIIPAIDEFGNQPVSFTDDKLL